MTAVILFVSAGILPYLFWILPPPSFSIGIEVGGGLLITAALPSIYFFLYRPLVEQVNHGKLIRRELENAKAELEARVAERTRELSAAKQKLEDELGEHKRTAVALKQAEEKYRSIYENAVDGIYQTSLEGRLLSGNPALAQIFGYDSPEELTAAHTDVWRQVYVDPDRRVELANKLNAEGKVEHFEFQAYRRDGSICWLVANSRLVRDDSGNPLYYEGLLTEITPKKNAEVEMAQRNEELQRSNMRLLDAIETLGEGFVMFGPDDRLVICNTRYKKLYPRSARLMTPGRPYEDILRESYRKGNYVHTGLCEDDWVATRLALHHNAGSQGAYEQLVGDRWILVNDSRTSEGGIISLRTDITARKSAEAELRTLSLAVEQSPASIVITDLKGNIQYVNPRFVQVSGYSREELIGKNPRLLKSGETTDEEYKRLWDTITNGGEWRGIFHNRKKNGELFWESAIITPIFDETGKIKNFLGVKEDITERKQAEEALRRSEERFRSVVENASDMVTVVAMDGTITYESPAVERMLGYKPEELIGQNVFTYLHPDDLVRVTQIFAEAIQQAGTTVTTEFRYRMRDGSWRHIEATGTARFDDQGELIGVINSRDIDARKQAEEELREALAATQLLVAHKEQRNNEMKLLSEMGEFLQCCQTAPEAYATVAQYSEKLFPNVSGALAIISASRNLVEFVETWGGTQIYEKIFSPDDCWALRRGRNYSALGTNPKLYCKHTTLPYPAASLCVPMMAQGEALGFLYLRSEESISSVVQQSDILNPAQIRLAQTMAEQIAMALANLNLREALRNQAIRDTLTGLYNRRYMEETFERELLRAERHGDPLGVIMMDIDHFKKFNDTFGHAAGDFVLHELGEFLRIRTRGGDFVCRYGGEEIVIVMLDISLDDAAQRAEQLRQEIQQLESNFHDEPLGAITVSCGVAGYPQHASNMNSLLRAADNALYRAKHEGRNRVVVASLIEETFPELLHTKTSDGKQAEAKKENPYPHHTI